MAVRYTQTGTTPVYITLAGVDSSPSLYVVPSGQMPPFKDFTVAVAIKVGDQVGPYSLESSPIGKRQSTCASVRSGEEEVGGAGSEGLEREVWGGGGWGGGGGAGSEGLGREQ